MGVGLILEIIGFAMVLAGALGRQFGLPMNGVSGIFLVLLGVLIMIGGIAVVLFSFYRRTSADIAFVRTGQGGSHVVLDGGIKVIPFLHNLLEVNLRTMKLGVNPRGQNALITHDNLRANVLAQFYIRVQADPEHILNAARSLGQNSVNAETVEALVSEKLVSALRAIASQMDLFEIHTKRDEFAERVKEHVKIDLESNGLLLESVTISELDQTDPSELSDVNVFDAQGKRKITEITAAAAVERNNLERQAEQARKLKDVQTRQQILALEQQQAEAEQQQQSEIAKIKAQLDRETQETQITQQRAIELAKIERDKQLQEQDIVRQQSVEIARANQEKAVQTAQIAKQQEIQLATVERDKSVELANRLKEIALAQQETARTKAEEAALLASAQKEKANQEVQTVQQLAEAERNAKKLLIASQQQIEQDKLKQQTSADVDAYARIKQAEAEQISAQKQGEAKRQLAEAEAQGKEMVARGEKAQQMVAVDVAREQVNVEQARVDVERKQLENRQEFAQSGIQLEVRKLSIQANRDVQMEFARAMASFLSNGHMTLYGTPETANTMMDNMAKGFGFRSLIEGFMNGDGPHGDDANGSSGLSSLTSQLGGLLQPALARLNGGGNHEASSEEVAQKLASDPAFLKALQAAIGTHLPSTEAVIVNPVADTSRHAKDSHSAVSQ